MVGETNWGTVKTVVKCRRYILHLLLSPTFLNTGEIEISILLKQFKVFYGKLDSAPLIEQCPINLECKVMHILNLGTHSLIVGKIEETYISEDCLTDGKPDVNRIKPFTYITIPALQYQALGEVVAKAFSIDKELKVRQ
jgi:hypothetical protein